jgi:CheY-like chemotaxis protein
MGAMRGESVAALRTRPTVLVVDDDHDARVLLRALLESEGYDVLTATEGRAALAQLETVVPDLILIDLRMPLMDGWELLSELQARAELAQIPIGVHSAEEEPTPPAGASFVLRKPVDARVLLAQLRDHIER